MLSVLQQLFDQGIAVRYMQPPLAESIAGPFIRRNWVHGVGSKHRALRIESLQVAGSPEASTACHENRCTAYLS
jgi:hypothetical protein